ncbi:MAG: S9 family peptidase [Bacteroidetes bacterium]|nr:S9 family peptidase [Bacteroidota bacterium]
MTQAEQQKTILSSTYSSSFAYPYALLVAAMAIIFLSGGIRAQITYQMPPDEIVDLVDAPATPGVMLSPKADRFLVVQYPGLASVDELAAPELRLAGIRINPLTNGASRARFASGLELGDMTGNTPVPVGGLPQNARITNISWSRDGQYIAFVHTTSTGLELWVVEVSTATARRLADGLNGAMGDTYTWLSENKLLFAATLANRGEAPVRPAVATGPVVQENIGRQAAVRTFQDMLRDAFDEAIFEYYASARLMVCDIDGNKHQLGEEGLITSFSPSPDGNYVVLTYLQKPFSYIVPYQRFPQRVVLIDKQGNLVRTLAEVPMADNLPLGFGAVRTGARSHQWRADQPASLYWVEALDGGDPARQTDFRDQVYFLSAPFEGEAYKAFALKWRFGGIIWGHDTLALVNEMWPRTRLVRLMTFNPSQPTRQPRLIWERSSEDRYNNPGRPQTIQGPFGQQVLMLDKSGGKMFLFGQGASPEGDRPFVDQYDLRTGQSQRLWQSRPPWYENPVAIVNPSRGSLIIRRESNEVQPNFYLTELKSRRLRQLTSFSDPMPQLKRLNKQMIHYQRADGVPLSGMLYLPPDFKPGSDKPLPAILWAYPQEFKSGDAAGQVSGSPYTYTRIGATSVVMLATQGYAVLDNASFPIVGEGDKEPNDTFVEQLVANAEAAINKLVEMGVADRDRIAVSGHSYGAFMTANLLTHSNLFAAGIARSGAYNRTLTPFGFQGEERTYWQAMETYHKMSPFMFADKMKTPLLLIHGADDNNSGTFPIQSERYYDALRGHGATVRLVMLPHESHGYAARESVLHMHWEWLQWLDTYVKNRTKSTP